MSLRRAFLAGGLLITIAIAGVVIFRVALLEALLHRQLSDLGAGPVQATVTAVGLSAVHIENLTLGPTLSLRRLSATYDWSELLDGKLETVLLEGGHLELDLTGDGPVLGLLEPLLSGGTGEDAVTPPVIRFVQARIEARTPAGPVTLEMDGRVDPLPEGRANLEAEYRLTTSFGALSGVVSAAGDPTGELLGTLLLDRGAVVYDPFDLSAEEITGAVAFELDRGQPRQVTVSLSADNFSLDQLASSEGFLALDLSDDLIAIDTALRTADGALDLEASGEVQRQGESSALRLQGQGQIKSLAKLRSLLPLVDGLDGDVEARFDLSGEVPALELTRLDTVVLRQWLLDGSLAGDVSARATSLSVGEAVRGGAARISSDLSLAGGDLTLTLREPSSFAVEHLGAHDLRAWGLPDQIARLLSGGAALALAGPDDRSRIQVSRNDQTVEIEATGSPRLTLADDASLSAEGLLRAVLRPDLTIKSYSVQDLSLRGEALVLGDLETETLALTGQLTSLDVGHALTDLRAEIAGAKVGGTEFPETTVTGDLTGSPHALSGSLLLDAAAPEVDVGDLTLGSFRLTAPIDLTIAEDSLVARLSKPGVLATDRIRITDNLLFTRGKSFSLDRAELSVPLEGPGAEPLAFELRLKPGSRPWSMRLDRGPGEPIQGTVTPGPLSLSGTLDRRDRLLTKVSAGIRTMSLPDYDLTLGGGRLTGQLDPTSGNAKADVRLDDLGLQDRFGLTKPVGLVGTLSLEGPRIGFDGTLTGLAPLDRTRVTVAHWLDQETGRLDIELDPTAFAPGGLQPSDLSTLAAPLSAVTGEVRGSAALAWTGEELVSEGRLRLSDLSFTLADMNLSGLDLDLRLDDLIDPQSPPAQSVTLARLDGPVAVDSLIAAFQIEPGTPARLLIQGLDFKSIGGAFSIGGLRLDPLQSAHEGVLEVQSLDLDRLTRALEIDGVTGSGNLKGQVPLRFEDGRLVITDARLRSTGPGILRYRSAASASLVDELKGETDLNSLDLVDDPFRLTLLALENFHYDSLAIRMGHETDGKANLKLAISGKNPELLDGYPFELNVNLDTNLLPLLDAIDSGLLVTKDLLPGPWSFGR